MENPQCTFNRILVATDFSAAAEAALKQAIWVARTNQSQLTVVHVLPDLRDSPRTLSGPKMQMLMELLYGEGEDFEEFTSAMERQTLTELQRIVSNQQASDLDIKYRVLHGETIIELTNEVRNGGFDLVLTGTQGNTGWEQFFIGSTAGRTIRQCPASVWIVKESDLRPPNVVLTAVDFSEASNIVAKHALMIAKQSDAEYHLLHVIDSMDIAEDLVSRVPNGSTLRDEICEEAKKHLDDFAQNLDADGRQIHTHLRWGTPWKEIRDHANYLKADLIAMGTVGRSGIAGLLLGNTAEKVLGACNSSILTAKPSDFVSPIP